MDYFDDPYDLEVSGLTSGGGSKNVEDVCRSDRAGCVT